MSSEKEMDQVSDKVAIMGLPEVFYGHNHLYVSSKAHDVLLDFNAIDALSFSGFDKRAAFLRKPDDVAAGRTLKSYSSRRNSGACRKLD